MEAFLWNCAPLMTRANSASVKQCLVGVLGVAMDYWEDKTVQEGINLVWQTKQQGSEALATMEKQSCANRIEAMEPMVMAFDGNVSQVEIFITVLGSSSPCCA